MLRRLGLVWIAVVAGVVSPARGEVVRYEFTGEVNQTADVLGLDVAVGSPVTGLLSYVYPDTVPDHSDPTGIWHLYTESLPSGFTATFISSGSPVAVRTGDYAVQVRNETEAGGYDGFAVIYSPFSAIPPTLPVTIGPDEYTNVNFRLDFTGSSSLYDGSAVPSSLAIDDFLVGPFFRIGSLAESDSFGSILFAVTNLRRVPEPSSSLLLAYGSGVLACVLLRRRRVGRLRRGGT